MNTDHTGAIKATVSGYLKDVVRPRDPARARDYLADDLVQHSPEVSDGRMAFEAFIADPGRDVPTANDDLEFMIAEGDLVTSCHRLRRPAPDGQSDGYDFFLFETFRVRDALIVERWSNLNAAALSATRPDLPAHTSESDGGAAEQDPAKALVLDFYRHVFDAQNPDAIDDFVAADYQQHASFMPPGREGLIGMARSWFPGSPVPVPDRAGTPHDILCRENDIVVIAGPLEQPALPGRSRPYTLNTYDAYQVRDGKLTAHWAGVDMLAPPRRDAP